MNLSIYFISTLSSCLTIILIFVNFTKRANNDSFQQKLLFAMLGAAFSAVAAGFISRYFAGSPGRSVRLLMYAGTSLFMIAQNCTYYLGIIFIDYFAYKSAKRSKRLIVAAVIFFTLYTISVIANYPLGYFFYISSGNQHVHGNLHLLNLIVSYAFLPLIIIDISLASKFYKHSQANLIVLFVLIAGMGTAMEVILKDGSLSWPCFAAAVLYLYFFILQSDSRIDDLTQIGNRASFNEFIDKITRQNVKDKYWIAMIDLDKFKEINDTLGHNEGDRALCDIADILVSSIRHSDFAARYGGDEFVIAVKAEFDMQRLMERIQNAIDLQNGKRRRLYQLYISYGFDIYTVKSGKSIYAFLAEIDALMYKQKAERKAKGIPSAVTTNIPVNEVAHV